MTINLTGPIIDIEDELRLQKIDETANGERMGDILFTADDVRFLIQIIRTLESVMDPLNE